MSSPYSGNKGKSKGPSNPSSSSGAGNLQPEEPALTPRVELETPKCTNTHQGDKDYNYTAAEVHEAEDLQAFIHFLNSYVKEQVAFLHKDRGGPLSDLSPALRILAQGITLKGYEDGSYPCVMPDLTARTLKLREDQLNTWQYRESFYRRWNPPYLTSNLEGFFNDLFFELFACTARVKAAVTCWVTDSQVPHDIDALIRSLGYQGRHGEAGLHDAAGWLLLEMILLTASYKTKNATPSQLAAAFLKGH